MKKIEKIEKYKQKCVTYRQKDAILLFGDKVLKY